MGDDGFRRRAGLQAFLVAGFSLAYAVVYLGFASREGASALAVQLAWALITAGALSAAIATFGLAGLWMLVAGHELRGRAGLRPIYPRLAMAGGVDLILLFVATLLGSTPAILVTGGLASVVLGPLFWAMTGRLLRG